MKSSRHLAITFILSTLALVTLISINMLFTDDVHDITNEKSFLSRLGILCWCVAATGCFFAATLLSRLRQYHASRFLLYSGLLTAYLLFDDFFELHEHYFPLIWNVDEKIIYILLGMAASILIIRFRRLILQTNYTVMLLALCFLAISVAADGILKPIEIVAGVSVMLIVSIFYIRVSRRSLLKQYLSLVLMIVAGLYAAYCALQSDIGNPEYLFEEGAKWLGITGWCSYFIHTAYQLLAKSYVDSTTK